MRSTDKQDRNDWTTAIAEIIRKLEMIPQRDKVHSLSWIDITVHLINASKILDGNLFQCSKCKSKPRFICMCCTGCLKIVRRFITLEYRINGGGVRIIGGVGNGSI